MVSNNNKKKRLLCESESFLIERRTLILKNDGKSCFSYETKASFPLFQWGEWVYDAQLRKKWLLCESVFILIDRRTLILKLLKREAFFMKPNH